MLRKFVLILSFIFLTAGFSGCDKARAKKYAGTYSCTVEVKTYEIDNGYWDTLYTETIEVSSEGTNIFFLNQEVAVAKIKKGDVYRVGEYSNYDEFQFVKDSLYYRSYSGGHGGNGSATYRGIKM